MTERPLSISTQIATPIQTVFNPPASISANDAPSATETVDDSTIKCICGYNGDDGSTIFCEACSTWQHIECFYPGRVEEASDDKFEHYCADCRPRPLDTQRATDLQRGQIENKGFGDLSDKKPKRLSSKNHRKKEKTKPSDLQVNGYHEFDGQRNGSPQDHHPHTKKSKGHRPTQSVGSQMKRSPPYNSRPNSHTHPPSPAHTPPDLPKDFEVHSFSETFQHLYDDDRPFQRTTENTFTSNSVTNLTIEWLRNTEKLLQDTGVENEKDALQYITADPKELQFPELLIDRSDMIVNDISRRFRSLITRTSNKEGCAIGELSGLVGFQKEYCEDPSNRWQEFVHPKPFVFFPSRLPLYIDARNTGSDCRYARRSCRPNTTVDTMIAHGAEYHFWLVSERQLNAGEQVTLPWDFRFPAQWRSRFLHLLNLGDPDGAPFDGGDITDEEYEQLTGVTHLVLSEYGGCACELGNDCAFARFHRNYHGRMHNQSNGVKSKKGRKSKQNHVSPTSTGHATNSRAASEGQQDQYDDDDSRSVSGSVRSKPRSRDLTPIHDVGANGIMTEPSDREKRKLAMLEDSFRKMEEQGQPSRKKKRTSEGSTMSGAASTTPQPQSKPRQRSVAPRGPISQLANGARTSKYVDASTSRRESDSPFTAGSPPGAGPSPRHSESRGGSDPYRSRQVSTAPKSSYTDASTQTDEVENAWYSPPSANSPPKRLIIPLSKRLLKNRLRLQEEINARRAMPGADEQSMLGSPTVSMDMDGPSHDERSNPESPTDARGRNASIASSTPSVDTSATATDINMTDAPAIMVGNTIKPPPPPWPNQSNPTSRPNSLSARKSPDLRVQMPPTPSFTTPNMAGTGTLSGNVTPSSAAGSIAQSPFGTAFPIAFPLPVVNGAVQSPAKGPKKLSLSDYRAKKDKEAAAKKPSAGSSPTVAPAVLKPSLSTIEEAKALLEGSAIVDTPITEKALDPLASSVGPPSSDASAPKDNLPLLPHGTM